MLRSILCGAPGGLCGFLGKEIGNEHGFITVAQVERLKASIKDSRGTQRTSRKEAREVRKEQRER